MDERHSLAPGGLLRCCVQTWEEMYDKGDLSDTIGTRMYCRFSDKCDPMKLDKEYTWRWDPDGPPLMIGQTT